MILQGGTGCFLLHMCSMLFAFDRNGVDLILKITEYEEALTEMELKNK